MLLTAVQTASLPCLAFAWATRRMHYVHHNKVTCKIWGFTLSAEPLPPWYQDLVHKKARLMTSDTMNRSTIMVMSTKLGATPTSKGGRWGLMLVKGGTMVAANAHDRAWKSIAYFCITHTSITRA